MITNDQLRRHKLSLKGAADGQRIALPDFDLSGADLFGANLCGVVGLTIAEEQGGQDHE